MAVRALSIQAWLHYFLYAVPIVVCHHLIHEGIHYLAALACGEGVLEFRFLTNGLGSSQVVYATPIAVRTGAHWLLIAWAPTVVTTAIGYVLYLNRERSRGSRVLAICMLYAGFFFLMLDPLYFSVLSLVVGGDIEAIAAVGGSPWPIRAFMLLVMIFNGRLMHRWMREQRARGIRGQVWKI